MFAAIDIVSLQIGRLKNYENMVVLCKWVTETKYNGIFYSSQLEMWQTIKIPTLLLPVIRSMLNK